MVSKPSAHVRISAQLTLFIVTAIFLGSFTTGSEGVSFDKDNTPPKDPLTMGFDTSINIEGNSDLTPANGVDSGSGTLSDPFIIRNVTIKVDGAPGISVSNTTAYLSIMNITLVNGKGSIYPSLKLFNATNIEVIDSSIYLAQTGIDILNCFDLVLDDITVNNSGLGIQMEGSEQIMIKNCAIFSNGKGLSAIDNNLVDLQSNDVDNNSFGFHLNTMDNTTVSSNSLIGNGQVGMVFSSYGTNITIIDNDIVSSS